MTAKMKPSEATAPMLLASIRSGLPAVTGSALTDSENVNALEEKPELVFPSDLTQ
jgi:hypothetical protein